MVLTIAERLAEVAVALLVAWPLARYLVRRHRRERWAAKVVAAAVVLLGYAVVVGISALMVPDLLRVIAAIALLAIVIFLWRNRGSYGRRRGLPPGSLAPASDKLFTDQAYYLKQYRRHGSVFKASPGLFHAHACIVGHATALEFLKSNGTKLAAPTPAYNQNIPKGFLRYMNEQDHRDYHKLFQAAMPPPLVSTNEAAVRETVRTFFGQWTQGDPAMAGISVEPAMTALMFAVMAQLVFGVSPNDPRYERLCDLHRQIAYGDKGQYDHRIAEPALVEVERLLFAEADSTGSDATTICHAVTRERPTASADPTVRRNLIYMLETGHRDMAGLLTWLLKQLIENRAWIERLQTDLRSPNRPPPDTQGRTLADRIIMEALRLERSEYLYRLAQDNVRLGPFTIPKGWIIRICIREGHRTNPVFAHPEEFDPNRFLDRTFDRTEYAPFGLYQRRCIGQNIAADVGRLFLEELFGKHDIEVLDDGPVQYRGGHWQPNTAFKLRLMPAAA